MKQIKVFTPLLWLALALSSLISCVSDDYNDWITRQPRAVVTVCPTPNGSYFMQLDDSTTLLPKGNPPAPYGKKDVRALVNYEEAYGGRRADDKPSMCCGWTAYVPKCLWLRKVPTTTGCLAKMKSK